VELKKGRGKGRGTTIEALREYRAEGENPEKESSWDKKRLDIFLYGNVMLGHGEGGDYIRCV
jgi:hypothetical protein